MFSSCYYSDSHEAVAFKEDLFAALRYIITWTFFLVRFISFPCIIEMPPLYSCPCLNLWGTNTK